MAGPDFQRSGNTAGSRSLVKPIETCPHLTASFFSESKGSGSLKLSSAHPQPDRGHLPPGETAQPLQNLMGRTDHRDQKPQGW